ncbi:MAG TPA: hypothetical protein PKM57_00125 [Kiritimatiellia bacterium]|nr:hypothetical protein [Kiritimatiellia bacterium]HPS09281.1 hypothetical protein [Kiritimatiellia bacterium]
MSTLSSRAEAGGSRRSGQAMLEYVVVFAALLAVVSILALFLFAVRQQSNRSLDLVASEYP